MVVGSRRAPPRGRATLACVSSSPSVPARRRRLLGALQHPTAPPPEPRSCRCRRRCPAFAAPLRRHPASGYVQGMNDLVTPFLAVFVSEHLPGPMDSWVTDSLPPVGGCGPWAWVWAVVQVAVVAVVQVAVVAVWGHREGHGAGGREGASEYRPVMCALTPEQEGRHEGCHSDCPMRAHASMTGNVSPLRLGPSASLLSCLPCLEWAVSGRLCTCGRLIKHLPGHPASCVWVFAVCVYVPASCPSLACPTPVRRR